MVWVLDPAQTQVGFAAQHLMVATVHGSFRRFDAEVELDPAQPERSYVTARIDAASLDTGNEERDRHLRSAEFLDVEQYPYIQFTSTQVAQVGPDSFWLRGELSVHGVTREVTLRGRFDASVETLADAPAVRFQMAAEVNREDFGLTWNSAIEAVGILVGRAITITIDAAVRQPDRTATHD